MFIHLFWFSTIYLEFIILISIFIYFTWSFLKANIYITLPWNPLFPFQSIFKHSVPRALYFIRVTAVFQRSLTHVVFYRYFGLWQRIKVICKDSNYITARINHFLIVQHSISRSLLSDLLKRQVPYFFCLQIYRPAQGALSLRNRVYYFCEFSAIKIGTDEFFGMKLIRA
jgi:hypothetical protein